MRFVEPGSSHQPDTTNKKGPHKADLLLFGALGEIRTPDQVVRSHLLYPAELRVRGAALYRDLQRRSPVNRQIIHPLADKSCSYCDPSA